MTNRSSKNADAPTSVYSRVSVKSQTVLPMAVRKKLRVAPGDRLRYIVDKSGIRLEKAQEADAFDPFASFTEWSSEEDEAAFADL